MLGFNGEDRRERSRRDGTGILPRSFVSHFKNRILEFELLAEENQLLTFLPLLPQIRAVEER